MSETSGSGWTDEQKEEVIKEYLAADPTPENTMDIVTKLAEDYGKTVNGVRMIITKSGNYVKKAPAKSTSSKSGGTRVVKADAIAALNDIIGVVGANVDEDITGRLTGKAAIYFSEVIQHIIKSQEDD